MSVENLAWILLFIAWIVAVPLMIALVFLVASRRRGSWWWVAIGLTFAIIVLPLLGVLISGVVVLVDWLDRRNRTAPPTGGELPPPTVA